jgi:hypothetical protein
MYREQKLVPGFALSPIDTEIIINYKGYDFLPVTTERKPLPERCKTKIPMNRPTNRDGQLYVVHERYEESLEVKMPKKFCVDKQLKCILGFFQRFHVQAS